MYASFTLILSCADVLTCISLLHILWYPPPIIRGICVFLCILLLVNNLSVPGGATIVTQMRANGVQQERKKKEKVERR